MEYQTEWTGMGTEWEIIWLSSWFETTEKLRMKKRKNW